MRFNISSKTAVNLAAALSVLTFGLALTTPSQAGQPAAQTERMQHDRSVANGILNYFPDRQMRDAGQTRGYPDVVVKTGNDMDAKAIEQRQLEHSGGNSLLDF